MMDEWWTRARRTGGRSRRWRARTRREDAGDVRVEGEQSDGAREEGNV